MLGRQALAAQRAYKAQPGWKMDPIAAAAPKRIARRFFQLKVGHAAIGTYLARIKARDSEICQGCHQDRETVRHLLFECREWRRQRDSLYKALKQAKVALPIAAEEHLEGRILGDPRATKAILQFLGDTKVGNPGGDTRALERAQVDNEQGWTALEEAKREGLG